MWMYHCHILDHAESGMMGQLWVAPAAGASETGANAIATSEIDD